MKLIHVVGARPNFMKVAPVWRAVSANTPFQQFLVHTGQHYDLNMSDVFFTDLGLSHPDFYLGVGSGSHAAQTAAIMVAFEQVIEEVKPDLVLVYGDVNSTVASALVCAKLLTPVAHVEAGLRSFDRTMPEEINRLLTDQIADILFTPSPDGDENLLREGVSLEKIHRVGNVMIDTLVRLFPLAQHSDMMGRLGLKSGKYAVLTLHRPANVDDAKVFKEFIRNIASLSRRIPIVFPVHPRTKKQIDAHLAGFPVNDLRLIEPVGYLDFLQLMSNARLVLTDSGGIQEETAYLGIPCLTLRKNTERPITVTQGTNTLIGRDIILLKRRVEDILNGDTSWDRRPPDGIPLWDGHAAERIVRVLLKRID